MEATLHTFIDIFDFNYVIDGELVALKKIIIPIIQRDYAQGRHSESVNRKRERFLEALKEAVISKPITLDFVYGDINKGIMTPLDGQQRLTTLFLLHWYAAKRDSIDESKYSFLKQFSYETRYSARDFCKYLIDFTPDFNKTISEEIIEQSWFPLDWKKDPTIHSMLVMLDSISEKFKDVKGLWDKLCNKSITFYFLPIKDMGLTDELYIKMNSRGKPLTDFEHFKAEFEREIKKLDPKYADSIINKIDIAWTDMLWTYRGDDNVTDDEFLRYFNFICDIICYKNGNTPLGKSSNEFDLLKDYFLGEKETVLKNVQLVEQYFDCWCNIPDNQNIKDFFNSFITDTKKYEKGKILLDSRNEINLFEACLRTFGIKKQFTLPKLVLLYAVITYLLNKENISFEQFKRRFRIINNLVRNSEDEIHNDVNRDGGNRLPAILKQVDSIIIDGKINSELTPNFNVNQLNEENEKIDWVNKNEKDILFELEDHPLLNGQISIIGIDNINYKNRFYSLFNCDWDKVDCALLAIGDYRQRNSNKWRYQLGSSTNPFAWQKLFHKSGNSGYENTKAVLLSLLSKSENFTDDLLNEISSNYLKESEEKKLFEWRYYYIKYQEFRPGRYGRYSISFDRAAPDLIKNYEMSIIWAERHVSSLAWSPYLKAIDSSTLSKDDYGMKLVSNNYSVICLEAGFMIFQNGNKDPIKSIMVAQTTDGIDKENRIESYKEEILKYLH